MNRGCWWDLPLAPSPQKKVVNGTEIVAITEKRIYSLKLKFSVQPPSATVLRHTKTMLSSMLFSPKFSDVTLVCPDGTEIPAHQVILSGNSLYFDTYFSGLWAEQHPDGRLQTEMTQDVIKPLLSLMYTGEILLNMNDSTLVGLLEAAYQLQLNDDLLRVCQKSVLTISMRRMSRNFCSYRQSHATQHFYLMRVSSTSVNICLRLLERTMYSLGMSPRSTTDSFGATFSSRLRD
jgi:hypothetical protein